MYQILLIILRVILKQRGILFQSLFVCIIYGPIRVKLINQSRPFPAGIVPSVADALVECKPPWRYRYRFLVRLARKRACGFEPQRCVYVHLQIEYLCLLLRDTDIWFQLWATKKENSRKDLSDEEQNWQEKLSGEKCRYIL